MRVRLFLVLLLLSNCLLAQHLHWSKYSPVNGRTLASSGQRVDIDKDGNTYVTGVFSKEITFDRVKFYAEFQNIFIAKYSTTGILQWAKQIGDPTYSSYTQDIKVDHEGNIILTGSHPFAGDLLGQPFAAGIFLVKFDSNGNLLWVQVDQETSGFDLPEFAGNVGNRFQIDQDNNIIRLSDNIHTYDSTGGVALTKYNSQDGSILWKKYITHDTYYHPMLNSITLDSHDNIIISGGYQDSLYIGTTQLKETISYPYLAKFNNEGDFLWVKVEKLYAESFIALETDKLDNIYAAGLSPGIFPTGFIARFTSDGENEWYNNFNHVGFVHPYDITKDKSDNFYISSSIYSAYLYQGHYAIKKPRDMDCFILKIDAAGNFESALTTNGTGYDAAPHQSKVDDLGNIYTIGHFRDTLVVSCDTMLANYISFFVTKHDQASLANIDFKIDGPDFFCEGAPTLLTTTEVPGSTEYIWNLPDGVTPTSGTNITTTNSIWVTATYDPEPRDLTMTREASCKDVYGYLFEVRVTPAPKNPALTNYPPLEICHSDKKIAYTVGNNPLLTYTWSLPPGVLDTISTNDGSTAYLKFSDTFTSGDITVTAKGGCRDVSSSFHINAVPYPDDATDLTGPTEICDGTSVTFKTSAINNITSYEWQIPDTFTPNGVIHSTDNFITAKVQSQGLRTVSVNGINKCDQKGNDKTLEVQTWDKVPIPFLKRMPCDREIVSSENENIEWYKDGILIPDFKYDHFPVLDSGIYQVRVSNFCNAEKSNTVKAYPLYESQLSVPNVITPNGDDKNQHFELEPSLRGSSLSIFNRYGKNVFESPNYNNKWMGEDLPMGVYYYLINNSCLTKPLRGWIQLLH